MAESVKELTVTAKTKRPSYETIVTGLKCHGMQLILI
jgi:hypothetical protein